MELGQGDESCIELDVAAQRESKEVLTISVTDSPNRELEYRFKGLARSAGSGSCGGLAEGSRNEPAGILDSSRSSMSLIWPTSLRFWSVHVLGSVVGDLLNQRIHRNGHFPRA